jgi:hypothetical protein
VVISPGLMTMSCKAKIFLTSHSGSSLLFWLSGVIYELENGLSYMAGVAVCIIVASFVFNCLLSRDLRRYSCIDWEMK